MERRGEISCREVKEGVFCSMTSGKEGPEGFLVIHPSP